MISSPSGLLITVLVAIFATTAAVALPRSASLTGYQQHLQQQQQQPPPPPPGFLTGAGGSGAALGAPSFAAAGLGAGDGFETDGGYSDGMGPPDPSKFRSPQDLKEYLERLQLYYALVGRPRFGKRSSPDRQSRLRSRISPIDRFRASDGQPDDGENENDIEDRSGVEANKGRGSGKIYGFAVIF